MRIHALRLITLPTLLLVAGALPARAAEGQTATAESPSLEALVADYQALAPAAPGTNLSGKTARIGHLEIEFGEGIAFPLRTPRGATMGLFFEGKGWYKYRSEDPGDRRSLALNLGRHARAPSLQDGTVRDEFTRVFLLFGSEPSPAFWDPPANGAAAPGPANGPSVALDASTNSAFARIWKDFRRSYLPWEHIALEARLNSGSGEYLYGELQGKAATVGYLFDRIRHFEERLFLFENLSLERIRTWDLLSVQKVEGGIAAHPPDLVLKDVQLRIVTEDNHSGTIGSDLTLQVTGDGLRVAHLALLNNRNPHSYDWSSPRNALRVLKVTDETGRSLPFSHRYHEILIRLRRAHGKGEFLNLKFETEGEIFTGLFGEPYNNYFSLYGEPWFPNPSGWNESGFTFTLKIRTRKPFVPVVSGTVTSTKEEGDFWEVEAESPRPMKIIAVFGGKYETREERFGPLTIRAHAYSAGRRDVLEKMPALAHLFLQFYGKALGPYSFDDLDIIEVPEFLTGEGFTAAFGIAPPGVVLITSEAYNARKDYLTKYFSRGVNARLAHEIAHQWFFHKAIPASPQDAWLSESFAEYLSGLAMAASHPDESRVVGFSRMLADWWTESKWCAGAGSLETATALGGEAGGRDRFCLLYDRGPLVLHMLHTLVGNDAFFAVLRRFLDQANGGLVTTADFQKAAAEVLHQDMSWFFDDWYRKGGIPEIRIDKRIETVQGKPFLVVRASQVPGAGFRRIYIPFIVDYGGGHMGVKLLFQDKPEVEARYELDRPPRAVTVDPAHNNLAVYR